MHRLGSGETRHKGTPQSSESGGFPEVYRKLDTTNLDSRLLGALWSFSKGRTGVDTL